MTQKTKTPLSAASAISAISLALLACLIGPAHADNTGQPVPMASPARPIRILVVDAGASPNIVQLDTSPGVAAQRNAAGITPLQAADQDILAVQTALSDTLVKNIQAMGLPAERVPAGTSPGPGELAVTTQITAIQEGSRARRTVIGLGAGKDSVQASALLLRGTGAAPEMLRSFTASANSGRMPGMGIGIAATGVKSATTALSGAAHGVSELDNSPVAKDAAKLANHLSTSLGQYFAAQNWIAPSAVP